MKHTLLLIKSRPLFYFVSMLVVIVTASCQAVSPSGLITNTENTPAVTASQVPDPLPEPTVNIPAATPILAAPAIDPAGIELNILSTEELDLAKSLGVSWVRYNALLWSDIEPEEGQRSWEAVAAVEEGLKNASARGLQVILIVRSTPTWAQKTPGYFCGLVQSEKLPAFASFMKDVVSRYSQAPFNVHDYELGNEPDIAPSQVDPNSVYGCMGDKSDPYYGGRDYAELLKAVYPVIKSADPASHVLVGGLLLFCDPNNPPQGEDCTPARYLEGILEGGGGPYFDSASFHGYDTYANAPGAYKMPLWNTSWDTTGPAGIAKANYLRAVIDRYGVSEKEMVNSETGVICGRTGEEDICKDSMFADTKTSYIVKAYVTNRAANIRAYIWFGLRGWRGSGLVDQDLQPVPAFRSYQFAIRELHGASYQVKLQLEPGLQGYAFNRSGVNIWVLWSNDGTEHQVTGQEPMAAVYDSFGEQLTGTSPITVGFSPVFIESAQ